VSATLSVTRKVSHPRFFELRRGRFEVSLDGKEVGSLQTRETTETPLEPGRHIYEIGEGRYSSRNRSFDAAEGEAVNFHCRGATTVPTYVESIVKPDVAISLRRKWVFGDMGRARWSAHQSCWMVFSLVSLKSRGGA
jgi:hypothetical protein